MDGVRGWANFICQWPILIGHSFFTNRDRYQSNQPALKSEGQSLDMHGITYTPRVRVSNYEILQLCCYYHSLGCVICGEIRCTFGIIQTF